MRAVEQRRHELFAVVSPGLERVVAAELRALGFADVQELPGGAAFEGTLVDAFRANVWLRTASRVLLRVGAFDAPGKRELLQRARKLNLAPFVAEGSAVHVSVSSQQSRLYHTGLIAETVREALGLTVAARDATAPILFVRLLKDRCTVSVDTSGELLHRRGYRKEVSRAPLRETLAAGMLLLCGYDGSRPFLDPMCGSGTLPIEAALIASGRAPNDRRAFAMEQFLESDLTAHAAIRAEARGKARTPTSPIFGIDVHGGALHAARGNAERADVQGWVKFERGDVGRIAPPAETGLLITNPPYGKRLSRERPRRDDPLAVLAQALAGSLSSWDRFVVGPGAELRRAIKLPVVRAVRLDNGGIAVEMLQYRPMQRSGATRK